MSEVPRLHSAERDEMSLLWAADQGGVGGEKALPLVWRLGIQDDSAGGGTAGREEGAEDHGVRGLRETGLGFTAEDAEDRRGLRTEFLLPQRPLRVKSGFFRRNALKFGFSESLGVL
jgi:hypothetical protein